MYKPLNTTETKICCFCHETFVGNYLVVVLEGNYRLD